MSNGMHRAPHEPIPQSSAISIFRKRTLDTFYPSIDVPKEDAGWQTIAVCFRELLKLEFYPHASHSPQHPKVTLADAKRYCEWHAMYNNMAQFERFFVVDPAIIQRLTNLIMLATFCPDGSGSPYFGPPAGKEELAVTLAYLKVWEDKPSLCAILNESSQDLVLLHNKFEFILTALRNFKVHPPKRDKLEST